MILVSQIYDTILSRIRKDKRGLSFSPQDFNNALVAVNQRIYRVNYSGFESSKLSMDEMDSLKVVGYPIVLDANGKGILPSNYFHLVGDPYYTHATEGRRKIDLITSLEHGSREMDYFTKASLLYPTCFMGAASSSEDMSLHITPITIGTIYIDYLREVNTPYLDYYVNNLTLDITYMDEGVTVAIPLGCTSRSGVSGVSNVVSLTKNFEWHDHDTPAIINELMKEVGIELPDEMLVNTSYKDAPIIERQ
jgi:hypothetical protein